MTSAEYLARREKILKAMAAPQSITEGPTSVTYRSVKDLQAALAALDAEYQVQNTPATPRIGRLYISGEGR